MIYTELVNKAIDIAYEAHQGQRDKAGRPYILHVFHVAEGMDDEYSACAALLHDTLEDTKLTAEDLAREFPAEVVEAVKLLTHSRRDDYNEYIRTVSQNPIACRVKMADLKHNLDASRFAGCSERSIEGFHRRKSKYEKALSYLKTSGGQ